MVIMSRRIAGGQQCLYKGITKEDFRTGFNFTENGRQGMTERDYYVAMAWKKFDDMPVAAVVKEEKFFYYPYDEERKNFAKSADADYITIERRYEYGDLPFGGEE
jgi:hypothetical protein